MVHAVVARPPQVFGEVETVDDSQAKAVKGVLQTIRLPKPVDPVLFQPLGGIAVVATDTWAAISGRKKLSRHLEKKDPTRSTTPTPIGNSSKRRPANPARWSAIGVTHPPRSPNSKRTVTAEYYVPNLSHSPKWSPCTPRRNGTTASSRSGPACRIRKTPAGYWQDFSKCRPDDIKVHATWLGGAFGRKSKPDFAVEAAFISREIGRPVKVTWTRGG
jgi:isoquinoline 1-oxidoreductase beta subunit